MDDTVKNTAKVNEGLKLHLKRLPGEISLDSSHLESILAFHICGF